jgi:hypothetical protein
MLFALLRDSIVNVCCRLNEMHSEMMQQLPRRQSNDTRVTIAAAN